MSDENRRRADRAAHADPTDDEAQERVSRERNRVHGGRHGDKLGQDVVIETVQCHWYGTLLGVSEYGGGVAIAHLHPCFWLSNTETIEGLQDDAKPRRVRSTNENPADVYLTAAVIVTLADEKWKHPL